MNTTDVSWLSLESSRGGEMGSGIREMRNAGGSGATRRRGGNVSISN